MNIIPIDSLSKEHVAAIATLHCVVMPTLLTDLGFPVVHRYYENAMGDRNSIGFAAFSPNGQNLYGWVSGSEHPSELTANLQNSPFWFGMQMTRVAFTRPRTLLLLVKTVVSPPSENLMEAGEVELTYIGVAPDARGQGIGFALLREFMATAQAQGYKRVTLSVETDNLSAIRMYKKAGFEITRTFREGRFERHRMSALLSTSGAQDDAK
jgi:ribosomal protein S18 acetylase RimI-like enzyme